MIVAHQKATWRWRNAAAASTSVLATASDWSIPIQQFRRQGIRRFVIGKEVREALQTPGAQDVSMLARKDCVAEKRRSNKVLHPRRRPNTFWLDTLCRHP
jgi:hypothetical protein